MKKAAVLVIVLAVLGLMFLSTPIGQAAWGAFWTGFQKGLR